MNNNNIDKKNYSNWPWVKLGDVCDVKGGYAFKSRDYQTVGIPLIRISNIEKNKVNFDGCVYIDDKDKSSVKDFVLHKGDILIALSGATTGKYGIYELDQKAYLNQRIGRIKFNESSQLLPSYLYNYLEILKEKILKKAYGAAQPNISTSEIANFSIPLPPLPEQHRIVEKIEELFSELDNGIENLKKAKAQIKTYRQSVLKFAFEGKLTQVQRTKDKGKSGNGELPEGWEWVRVKDICDVVRGGSPRPAGNLKYYDGNIPFLKVRDLTKDTNVYLTTFEYTIKEAGLSKTRKINPNTLLISNSGATLGVPKICLIEATMNDGIAAFLNLDKRSMLYIYYFWLSKTEELRNINMGAAQPNLNTNILKNYLVPYCSFEEQTQIVSEIERRFSVTDNMEAAIDESLKKAEALRQSILKQAFEGKLC